MQDSDVTVLGLGLMGRALAGAFVAAGHRTTVWNRTPGREVPPGARVAATAREAAAASPLVVVCVTDHEAVREVLDPLGDVLAGRVLVNLTSGTSQQARDLAGWAEKQDVGYLDRVVLAVPAAIGTAEGVVLLSGSGPAFDAHEATLRSLGAGTAYLGPDAGLAALYDMAMLSVMWNVVNGFLHGAALLRAAQVPAAAVAPVVNRGIESMTAWVTAYAAQVDAGEYPAVDATLDTHRAAMDHFIAESEALGVDTELPRFLKALTDRAAAGGHGGASYAVLVERFAG